MNNDTSTNNQQPSAMPDYYDRQLGALHDLPDVTKVKASTIRTVPPLGIGVAHHFQKDPRREGDGGGSQSARAQAGVHVEAEEGGAMTSVCQECGAVAQWVQCHDCAAWGWTINCGHFEQPGEFAAGRDNGTGLHFIFCRECARGR